jgi:hypothetical protein
LENLTADYQDAIQAAASLEALQVQQRDSSSKPWSLLQHLSLFTVCLLSPACCTHVKPATAGVPVT